MNYDKFKKLVPEETHDALLSIVKLTEMMYDNSWDHEKVTRRSTGHAHRSSYNYRKKQFYTNLLLLALRPESFPEITSGKYSKMDDMGNLFDTYKEFLLIYEEEINYLDISIFTYITEFEFTNKSLLDNILADQLLTTRYYNNTNIYTERDKFSKEYHNKLDREFSLKLPSDVYEFLNSASRIMQLILEDEKNKFILNDYRHIALLLTIYFYESDEAQDIRNYFESNSLKLDMFFSSLTEIKKITNGRYKSSYMQDNIFYVKLCYMDYIEKLGSNISITKIIASALDSKFTQNDLIDVFLANNKIDLNSFQDISEKISKMKKETAEQNAKKEIAEFYESFDKNTIDFIKKTFKIYTLIMSDLSMGKCNTDLIKDSDDVDTLSILISSYLFNGKVSDYFIDHSISLDSILNLLKLNIEFDKIDDVQIDEINLIHLFKRFINDGVNDGMDIIDYNCIISNLCDREFNKSHILEEIYGRFNKESLPQNFLSYISEYFEEKEAKRINTARNELFAGLDYNTIKVIEWAYIDYIGIITHINNNRSAEILKKMKDEDYVRISILLAVPKLNTDFECYMNKLGFDFSTFEYNFGMFAVNESDLDIDTIKEKYYDIIFGGINKNKDKTEITDISLVENSFDEKNYSSIELMDALYRSKVDYSIFDNLEKKFNSFILEKQDEADKEKYLDNMRTNNDYSAVNIILTAINIYEKIDNTNLEDNDKKFFSLLLSIATKDSETWEYFTKNGISKKLIFTKYGINKDILNMLDSEDDIDARKYKIYFEDYLGDLFTTKYANIESILSKMYKHENKIFADMCGNNYNRIVAETINKKSYEETLSLDEKSILLSNVIVNDVDTTNMSSLIEYGNELAPFSRDFSSTYINLDSYNPLEEIMNMVAKLKPRKVTRNKRFIFNYSVEEILPAEKITPSLINEISNKIDNALDLLRNDIATFDSVIKYIKVYIAKTDEYITKLDEAINEVSIRYDYETNEIEKYQIKLMQNTLETRKSTLVGTSAMWKQELFKYLQLSFNHTTNIDSLTIVRDSLLPLISSETLINRGLLNESNSMQLQANIFGILDGLVSKNEQIARNNLNQMRSILPSDLMDNIEKTVNRQIEETTSSDQLLELK